MKSHAEGIAQDSRERFSLHHLLRYMHRNPVKRGLVELPERWRRSSYRYYRLGEEGLVKIGS
jgi:hypothetical protein